MESNKLSSVFVSALSVKGIKPFRDGQNIVFWAKGERIFPAQWTIIIGNNNTGKTRLLKSIAKSLLQNEATLRSADAALEAWAAKEIKDYLSKNKVNRDALKEGVSSKIVKDVRTIVLEKIKNLGDVALTTMYREETLDKIADGHYIPTRLNSKDIIESINADLLINLDEEEFRASIPKNSSLLVVGYGVNRTPNNSFVPPSRDADHLTNLINNENNFINVEDWLIQTDYAMKSNVVEADEIMKKAKEILTSGILPDVDNFRFISRKESFGIISYVEFHTPYGWNTINELGYGYKASIAWIFDLVKRMLDHYSEFEKPLSMPAIVLIDELDLHLHPSWQRRITQYLTEYFPNVQFIVTTHSPLIIQSADNLNLILLKREQDSVVMLQPQIDSYLGWSVEEIMSELMGLEDNTFSDMYLTLMADFDKALDEDNIENAKAAYEKLDAILPPDSGQRKILKIQMSTMSTSN